MPTSEDERPIVIHSFPASDQDFASATGDALADAVSRRVAPETLREVVEQGLRAAYRNARIHVQDELGHLGAAEVIWYAYRDGRIREVDARRERLYSVVAAARRTMRESEVAMNHSREITRAAGYQDEPDEPD